MNTYDVAILGGGPAGLSAALWAAELGLTSVIIEKKPELGGQLAEIHNPINNYIGISAANGRELLNFFLRSLEDRAYEIILGVGVERVDPAERIVHLEDGRNVGWKNLIAATGVRRRQLGVEGEAEFVGRGVLTSGSLEKEKVRGKRVVIVGGGDAALENATILGEYASKVTVIHRSEQFRAREDFLSSAGANSNIEFLTGTRVKAIHGGDHVRSIEISDTNSGSTTILETDHVLIRIGVVPNSEWLRDIVELDAAAYAKINEHCQTSVTGIYACGDLAFPSSPTIATAVGSAVTAVKFSSLKEKRR